MGDREPWEPHHGSEAKTIVVRQGEIQSYPSQHLIFWRHMSGLVGGMALSVCYVFNSFNISCVVFNPHQINTEGASYLIAVIVITRSPTLLDITVVKECRPADVTFENFCRIMVCILNDDEPEKTLPTHRMAPIRKVVE